MKGALLLILPPGCAPSVATALLAEAAREVGPRIDVRIAGGGRGGDARNQAIAGSSDELSAFVCDGEPLDGEFLEEARRRLDADAHLGLVTGFGDRVPAALGGAPRPLDETTLLARPLAAHVPTVFRRGVWAQLGGFDVTLPAGEEPDLWLRALDAGVAGAVIEARLPSGRPWQPAGPPPPADDDARWAPFFTRHATRVLRAGQAALLHKERMFRELERRAAAAHAQRRALDERRRALEALEAHVAQLERTAR